MTVRLTVQAPPSEDAPTEVTDHAYWREALNYAQQYAAGDPVFRMTLEEVSDGPA
jgi:hypothetical protein